MSLSVSIRVLVAATLCALPLPTCLQADDTARFDEVKIRESATQLAIQCIAQDQKGFIWIGTKSGLFQYDGYEFTQFTHNPNDQNSLANSNITHMAVHKDSGVIWLAMESGEIDAFDPRTKKSRHFSLAGLFDDPIASGPIEDIFCSSGGTIWAVTHWGKPVVFDDESESFSRVVWATPDSEQYEGRTANQIIESGTNCYWISFNETGPACFRWVDGEFVEDEQHSSALPPDQFSADTHLFADSANTLWILSWGQGTYRLDPDIVQPVLLSVADAPTANTGLAFPQCIVEDADGQIWVGTSSQGIFKFDRFGNYLGNWVANPGSSSGLSSDNIQYLFRDSSDSLWIGTDKGLNKYSKFKHKFTYFTSGIENPDDASPNLVLAFCEDRQGNLWSGTLRGSLIKHDKDGNFLNAYLAQTPDGIIADTAITALAQSGDNMLVVGTSELGLLRFDIQRESFERFSESHYVSDILVDRQGDLWVATFGNGLGKIDSGTSEFNYFLPQSYEGISISSLNLTTLHEDHDGNIWIGTEGSGLIRFETQRGVFTFYRHSRKDPGSISDNRVLSIAQLGEFLWVGTRNGLNRMGLSDRRFERFYAGDALPDNVVCGVLPHADKYLWVSTTKGIVKIDIQTMSSRHYGVQDGLKEDEFNPGAAFKDTEGRLCFGGINGFTKFHPGRLEENPHPPNVVITSMMKFNEPVTLETPLHEVKRVELDFSENIFSFTFAALDYAQPDRNQYAYQLVGHDRDWIHIGSDRTAHYSQVQPGRYFFHVRGTNNDGLWSETAHPIEVIIIPPFWMTWEFRISMALLAAGVGVALYKLRTRSIRRQRNMLQEEVDERKIVEERLLENQTRLRSLSSELTQAEERERQRISQALHDNIGHALSLSTFKLQAGLEAMDPDSERAKVRDSIDDALELINKAIDDTRTLTVEISPPSLYKFGLEAATEELLERFGKKYGIKTVIEAPDSETALSTEVIVLIYQAIRELLVNIIKHAEATKVHVSILCVDESLVVKVRDDGKGFDVHSVLVGDGKLKGFGLYSIRERLEQLGGKMRIQSKADAGAEITLTSPITVREELTDDN